MKIHVLSNRHRSFETAKEIGYRIDTSQRYEPYRRFNQKWTKRRYWLEQNKKGQYRIYYSSFDSTKQKWSAPQSSGYFDFATVVFEPTRTNDHTNVKKIFVHENLHSSYIDKMLEEYAFDPEQTMRLKILRDKAKANGF